jgi:hypothetical protein
MGGVPVVGRRISIRTGLPSDVEYQYGTLSYHTLTGISYTFISIAVPCSLLPALFFLPVLNGLPRIVESDKNCMSNYGTVAE